jgi:predicted cupin superfamily sugar epimerase
MARRVGLGGSATATGAGALIAALGMSPHPEGGHYVETWRDAPAGGSRGSGSAILFLLRRREVSRWHRVDAAEVWHHCGGAPLELAVSTDGRAIVRQRLGDDVLAGDRPQIVVPAGAWQSARSLGAWTLVGCTVSPAFSFEGFELAPDGWEPGR